MTKEDLNIVNELAEWEGQGDVVAILPYHTSASNSSSKGNKATTPPIHNLRKRNNCLRRLGMRTSAAEDLGSLPSILGVRFEKDLMHVDLSVGRIISVPLAWYPRLAGATLKQLKRYEISPAGYGLHWPDVDEDLSDYGFLFPRGFSNISELAK